MPPSINDVARKAGVSTATVSRTFRSPSLLNAETHDRVMEAARLLNYKPRRSPTGGGTRTASSARSANPSLPTDAIGFQFFSAEPSDTLLANSFYARILSGAQAESSRHGCHLLVHTTNRHALTHQMPRMVGEKTIGGMLLVGTADPDVLSAFAQHIPRLVLVDNRDTTGIYESVISDGFGGGYALTKHLLDLGHKDLIFACDDPTITTFADRLRGFLCAQIERGITPRSVSAFGAGAIDDADLEGRLVTLLACPDRPTALVVANDHQAFTALRACRMVGLSVPDDISVVGFDDLPLSAHVVPGLTTVRVDTIYMGVLAVRRLLAAIARENGNYSLPYPEPSVCSEIPVTLTVRQSCGPPKTV